MEKYLIWYVLLLKRNSRRPVFWLLPFCFLLLLWLLTATKLPADAAATVLLTMPETAQYDIPSDTPSDTQTGAQSGVRSGASAQALLKSLQQTDSVFTFETADTAEQLKEQVRTGRAQCGFLLAADFEQRLSDGDTDGLITYVYSPYSTKGAVARETVSAQLFRLRSALLLQDNEQAIFGTQDPQRTERIAQRSAHYLGGKDVFHMDFQEVGSGTVQNGQGRQLQDSQNVLQPVHGLAALMVFLSLLFSRGEQTARIAQGPATVLAPRERRRYRMAEDLAAVTLQAVAGFAGIRFLEPYGYAAAELGLWLLFLLWCCVWTQLLSVLLRREKSYGVTVLSLLLLSLLLCPIFWDVSQWIPAASAAADLLPVGLYLHFTAFLG